MRLGLRTGLLLTAAGALAGCLTSNPNLEESEGSAEAGSTASTDPSSGPTSSDPTSGPTTAGPTTAGPTTVDPDTTDTEPTTGGPTTDTDETTGPAGCGGGNVCVGEAPAGWAGPVVWAETPVSDERPPCPDAYPELEFEAFDDLQAAPADCDCECGAASGASCASVTLEYHGTDVACLTSEEEFTVLANGTCSTGPDITTTSTRRWEAPQPGVIGGDCTPSAMSSIPPATWNAASTLCGGVMPSAGRCEASQVCVDRPPESFESRICVWQEGALECPDGAYEDRFLRHASVDDGRNCATCTCGDPEGDCNGNVILRPTTNCSGGAGSGSVAIGGGCAQSFDQVLSAEVGTLSVSNVACEPSVGTAIGEAEPDDPYTLCCLTVE